MKKYRRLIAMGLALSLLSLFGCTKKEEKFRPAEDAEIVTLSIFESNMDLNHCYSFWIHEDEDGTVLFSAEYRKAEDGEKVTIDDCEVDGAYMDAIRKIAEKNGMVEYFKAYKPRKVKVFALDAPSYSCTIIMSDGSQRTIDSSCDGCAQLRDYFTQIAER